MSLFNYIKSKVVALLLALTVLFAQQAQAGYAIQDDW